MKRSGLAVTEARRVIEIDEVFEATMASGLRNERSAVKILRLTSSFSDGRLDHEIAIGELVEGAGDLNAVEDRLALRFVHLPLGNLARQVAVDGRQSRVDALLRDVVEGNGQSRLSRNLSDAGAHLPRADDADRLDTDCHVFAQQTARARARS